ncbi:glycerol-3-phosphate acyltransferase [Fictibacillus nanhaiensis]|jgi:acyl phosphate:glycerol-3-phosphate acyltransferase|uniref:glycerol-3-phosphate acyltransferase n=1 Tax=Fictibacillus nanhaiensis TaxID=742169 RepID=UPI00203C9FBE|nr:glycerol-3-phosphate acyltransferase [Fictibacillus nanhaiensis]MCM3731979.1 glycerol-3-phosphate acyltransferase [Fictibacillus nanhaiensis]
MIIQMEFQWVLYLIVSYLVGGLMTGFLVAKLFKGHDLRVMGSGNIGARNAGRVLGPSGFVLTLAGDIIKAAAVVWAGIELGFPEHIQLLGFLAVIMGHLYPVFLRFHGGKGVASFIGGLIVFNWLSAVLVGVAFLLFYSIKRSLTVAGLFAFTLSPFFYWLLEKQWIETLILIPISLMVVYVQKDDIKERIMIRE